LSEASAQMVALGRSPPAILALETGLSLVMFEQPPRFPGLFRVESG
jgi:hypothetical protein